MFTTEERRIRRNEALRRYKKTEKGREALKRYDHSPAKKEANAKYRLKHKWEARVQSLVHHAKKLGTLLAKPCQVCGKPNAFAHHDDYNKPLEVKWLCNYHHSEYHRKLGGNSERD